MGQSKSGVIGEKLPIWDLYNKVLNGAHNKVIAHRRFLFYHKDSIAQVTKNGNFNLFLPKELGGSGFKRQSPDIRADLTFFQKSLATFLHNRIIAAYKIPTIGFVDSYPRLVDENAPTIYEPYTGDVILQFIKKGEDIPEGFALISDIPKPSHSFIHTNLDQMVPKLSFKSISTNDIITPFRKSNLYKGTADWVGYDTAMAGNYPYVKVQSIINDQESFNQNEKLLDTQTITELANELVIGILESF